MCEGGSEERGRGRRHVRMMSDMPTSSKHNTLLGIARFCMPRAEYIHTHTHMRVYTHIYVYIRTLEGLVRVDDVVTLSLLVVL